VYEKRTNARYIGCLHGPQQGILQQGLPEAVPLVVPVNRFLVYQGCTWSLSSPRNNLTCSNCQRTIKRTLWRCDKMTTLSATEARKSLYNLVDDVALSHDPIQIVGKRHTAVLIAEDDWRAIQETLYLTSIPGMRESIREGLKSPIEECSEEPAW
jgi:PHD/YefM family antitoxin component YafN of YafNO toxin-antitoxin module